MRLITLALALVLANASLVNAASAKKVNASVEDRAFQPIEAAKENRIVRYTFSPEVIFRIFAVPNLHTHIELAEDEGLVEKPVLGDTIQWMVSGGPRNLYVKPVRDDIDTSMTVVTNKRTYQFQLIAGKQGAKRFQKVSFEYPDRDAAIKLGQEISLASAKAERDRLSGQIIRPNVDPASLNFAYEIDGDAPFKPTAVYSDDKFTYLRMPSIQDLPAVFLIDDAGNPSLINYKPETNLIIVERVAKKLLLKLGAAEVRISQKTKLGW